MKSIFITLGLTLLVSISYCQNLTKEFGKVTMEDFNYTPKDKKAEAVTLFDIGKVTFEQENDGGFNIRYIRTKRIKILKEEGIEQANISIPLYFGENDKEYLRKVEAYVYSSVNGDFQKIKFDDKQIYDEKKNDNIILKKFTLPQVSVGSVIEYKYIMYSPFYFQLPTWSFQSEIPTLYSEFEVRMVPYYEYYFTAQNITRFSSQNSKVLASDLSYFGNKYQEYQHRYIMKNVPAFRDESFISSKRDYLMKINFQIAKIYNVNGGEIEYVSTWEKFRKDLMKKDDFGRYIDKAEKECSEILEVNPQLLEGSELQKVKKIVEYVKSNFIWNNIFGIHADDKVKDLLQTKTGSSADINLFLIGFLRAAGINSNPVILSSRGNGKINSDYPFQHYYNYVVAHISTEKGEILSDATTPLLGFNELPIRCINDKGMLLMDKEEKWIQIFNNVKNEDKTDLKISFSDDLNTSKVDVMKTLKGMDAYAFKINYNDNKEEMKSYFEENGIEVNSEVKTRGFNGNNKPYFVATSVEVETEQLMNKIIIRPFFNFSYKKNPFTEEKRSYDIDLIYERGETINSVIQLPEGYTVHQLPIDKKVDNEIVKIDFKNKRNGNTVMLSYSYQFKKAKYTPAEYVKLKNTFAVLVDKFNCELVLEKVEE